MRTHRRILEYTFLSRAGLKLKFLTVPCRMSSSVGGGGRTRGDGFVEDWLVGCDVKVDGGSHLLGSSPADNAYMCTVRDSTLPTFCPLRLQSRVMRVYTSLSQPCNHKRPVLTACTLVHASQALRWSTGRVLHCIVREAQPFDGRRRVQGQRELLI